MTRQSPENGPHMDFLTTARPQTSSRVMTQLVDVRMRTRCLLLVAAAVSACAQGSSVPGAPALIVVPASEPRELLPDQQVQQVLNRLAFGARPGDVEKVRAMGVDKWIALQLAPERLDDAPAEQIVASYESLGWKTPDIVGLFNEVQRARRLEQRQLSQSGDTAAKRDARLELRADPELMAVQRKAQRVVADVQSSKLARAVVSERQLNEVMVDFWENHFSVFAGKGQTRYYLTEYDRDVIRPHALGKFRDLLGAVAHSPAMLFYLDNWQSAADSMHPVLASPQRGRVPGRRFGRPGIIGGDLGGMIPPAIARDPELRRRWEQATPAERERFLRQTAQQRRARGLNENYARELMELHTLGVDGGYTQQDVINVARALTGWSIEPRVGAFVFRPEFHDAAEKVILGRTFPAGHGEDEGEQVLDMLAKHPSTAHFIARKLAVHFVADSAPPQLVERAAQTFLRTNGDIREVVRTIVTSPEFFSRAAYRAKVKAPFELVASALRVMGARPDTTPRTVQVVARLGQPMFGRQTPDGWPDRGDAWMNTGAILNRINFGLALAAGRVPGATLAEWPGTAELRAGSRQQQADGVIKRILGGEASPETRSILVSGENPLLSKLSKDSLGRIADDDPAMMGGDPVRDRPVRPNAGLRGAGAARGPLDRPVALNGLAQVVGLALGAPEFQRR
jgi:uncharacterized protein (DUF1800 family)